MSNVKMEEDHLQTNTSSNQSGSNDFVKKLFQMLQEDSYKSIVRWTKNGDSFVVIDNNEFTKEILPRHFKHSNFASFVRQLNKYDFHKVKVTSEGKKNYEYGDDAWEFKHPEFRINDRDALENIKRKGTTSKKTSGSSNLATPAFGRGNLNPDDLIVKINKLQSSVETLKKDNVSLSNQLTTLDSKYKYLTNYLGSMKSLQETNHSSLGVLVNALAQNGIKLPPLDFPDPSLILGTGSHTHAQTHKQRPSMDFDFGRARPAAAAAPANHQHSHSHGAINQSPLRSPHQPLIDENVAKEQQPSGGHTASSTPPQQAIMTTNIPNPKFHVLLVEDDNVCIQLCRKFLVKYGCQVTVVTDGLNAISTVENNKYDLVLMDIVMPNLDGASATSVIRSFDTRTPIIAMTGNIEDNDLVNYLQNGMSDILAKPFTKDDLYSILAKHLLPNDHSQMQSPTDNSGQLAPVPVIQGQVPQVPGQVPVPVAGVPVLPNAVQLPAAPVPIPQDINRPEYTEERELKKQRT